MPFDHLEWVGPEPVTPSPELVAAVGDALVAQLMTQRGIADARSALAFLDPQAYRPASADDLPDMARAVERIDRAIAQGERVLVWGDFDVDGQTATALLVSALREAGLSVDYYIPDRRTEGHGIAPPRLAERIAQGRISLVVTCDTGIAAHPAIEYAQSAGVDVIVTDHHQLPDELPPAYACINPQRLTEGHPLRALPGVGVAYKLIEALAERHQTWSAEPYLDLVALGIVADLAALEGDTRYLLQRGLAALRRAERLGIAELFLRAQIEPHALDEQTIAFQVAPRLNAIGRLGDASQAVELLTTYDPETARRLSHQIEALNVQRKLLTQQTLDSALALIDREPYLLDSEVLVLAQSDWDTGVIGIVANDLVERYQRPAILFHAPKGGIARGSARSLGGIDITALIASCSHITERYGGHAMAAGLSVRTERLPELRRALSNELARWRGAGITEKPQPTLRIAAELPLEAVTDALVTQVERLAPFGVGNPAPVFRASGVRFAGARGLGRGGIHHRLSVQDAQDNLHSVYWWGGGDIDLPDGACDLAYRVRMSVYRGKRERQLELVAYRTTEPVTVICRTGYEVRDHRADTDAVAALRAILAKESRVCIWNEGDALAQIATCHRHEVYPAEHLVIWSQPPSQAVIAQVVGRVQPRTIHVFMIEPANEQTLATLVQSVGGMLRYAISHHSGMIDTERLASATGMTEPMMRLCVGVWVANKAIRVVKKQDKSLYRIETSSAPEEPDGLDKLFVEAEIGGLNGSVIESRLKAAFDEAQAFRAYLRRTTALPELFRAAGQLRE